MYETNARRVYIKSKTGKMERGGETRWAELPGDGMDEAEDDVVVIGKVTVFLFAVAVTCGR